MGSAFLSTHEANVDPVYRNMVIESTATDIVYSNLFTGVYANFLRGSVARAGYDPDNLESGDMSTMNFGESGTTAVKVWRDIWSAGHGVGALTSSQHVSNLVDTWVREYAEAIADLESRVHPQSSSITV